MRTTFAVDSVTPATTSPRTRRFGDVAKTALVFGGDAEARVLEGPRTHPLLGAVHVAFAEHRPLVLSPDAVWLTIAEGLARHVRLHAETLRARLVPHDGTRRLTVRHDGPFPTDPDALAGLVAEMVAALAAATDGTAARLFACDFSTTTSVERTASQLVLLTAYSPYFDWELRCVCGIPSITLTGTAGDWSALRARIDALAPYVEGTPLAGWPAQLATIVDPLVRAVRGEPDCAFFQRIYKPKNAYGGEKVTGWIGWLYPYVGTSGRYEFVNPLLAHAPDRPLPGEDRPRAADALGPDWWSGPGLGVGDVPAELGEVLFHVVDERSGARACVTMAGGLAAIGVNEDGALEPRAAWWCSPGTASIDELAERLVALGARRAEERAEAGPTPHGVAEVDALCRAVAPFELFEGAVKWLARSLGLALRSKVELEALAEFGSSGGAQLLATYRASTGERVYVLVPRAAVGDVAPGACVSVDLDAFDVPVIARTLADALGAALDARGIPSIAPLGSLFEFLGPELQFPRLPFEKPRPLAPVAHVPLAPRTTLELGGAARWFVEARTSLELAAALRWAEAEGLPAFVLGGGSNLLVPDEGYAGLVIAVASRGIATMRTGVRGAPRIRVTAAAGEPWDELVAMTVVNGWQGLECLSGIPGLVGSTPVQNVGAYGQDVSQTIVAVGVLDRATLTERVLTPRECEFAYRDSALKRDASRYVVTWVTFELVPGGAPVLAYAELRRALADREAPSLSEVRETVIALRRSKSMVLDAFDPNRRSAGSFFTNPIVSSAAADEVVRRALELGIVTAPESVPRWVEKDGRVKLAAGWLIEKSGIAKGLRHGNVGVSSAHALALVHHGGGTTAELLALAEHVAGRVAETFGVRLEREPVLLA